VVDERIRVDLERGGGFGGLVTRRALDTADLPPEAAGRLRELLDGVDLDSVLPATPGVPVPDAYRYRLVVVRGNRRWDLSLSDPEVPAALRPLLRHLLTARPPAV
jgi:hypothetical protein